MSRARRAPFGSRRSTGPGGSSEASFRALIIGCGIGALLAAANTFMGLKTGWWDTGSITASILGYVIGSRFGGRGGARYSILENNITQTAASAAGAMPATAGLLGSLPAMAMLGHHVPLLHVAICSIVFGALGVVVGFALRERLIEQEDLPFPSGIATAEVINRIHGADAARGPARALFLSGAGASLWVGLRDVLRWVPASSPLPGQLFGVPMAGLTLGASWSPIMLGAGALVGSAAACSVLLGSIVAWVGIAPALVRTGIVARAEYDALAAWLIWPGLGVLAGGTLVSLIDERGQVTKLLATVRDLAAAGRDPSRRRGLLVVAALVAAVVCVARAWLGLSVAEALLAVALALPLAVVASRSAGHTDIAPLGQVSQLSQGAFGALSTDPTVNLAGGSIVSGVGAQTTTVLWSLRAGQRLGADPRAIARAQMVGIVFGALVSTPIYLVVPGGYMVG